MADEKDEGGLYTPSPTNDNSGIGSIRIKSLQRSQIISTFQLMQTNIHSFAQMSACQLEVKLSQLERQLVAFEKVQSQLESLDESEILQDHRLKIEDAYFEIKSAILERIALQRTNTFEAPLSSTRFVSQGPSSQRPVLPILQLPKFSGNYKDWMEFYNVFCQLVHDNQELSQVSKFQYLKSCLTGNASRLIQSLEVTSDNYEVAFRLLRDRYDNKRQLFQSHLLDLFNIQKITKPSVSSLRSFIDNVNATMRALESIASKEQIADNIILHLVVSRLDIDLQMKWEDSQTASPNTTSTLVLPTWDDLASFLEHRCKTIEIYESSHATSKDFHQKQHNTTRAFFQKPQTTTYVSSNPQSKCLICNNSPHHSVFRCSKFVDMNVHDRFNTAKRFKLCLNCLGTNHIASSCPSLNKCQKCCGSHHTLLHRERSALEETPQDMAPISEPPASSCLQVCQDKGLVILATAMVELRSPCGPSTMVRALLDSCSQSNFITERMAQRLKLPRKKVNIDICGIGGTNAVCAKYSCTVTACSVTSEYSSVLDAIVISSISSCHPRQHVNISGWNLPENIKLADKGFNIPAAVDLLIGADLFWDILMVGKIRMGNQLNIIKTKLGWIVSGSMKIPENELFSPQILTQKLKNQSTVLVTKNYCSLVSQTHSANQTSMKHNCQALPSKEPLLETLLQSFWKIENYEGSQNHPLTTEEEICERLFTETTTRCSQTNKFIVRLPFKVFPPDLGESRQIAQRRFTFLEAKFARDREVQREYCEFLDEYRSLDHMLPTTPSDVKYYIPHHCVLKPDSSTTRLRVVFDASCATTNGKSLNEMFNVGPTLQDDVFTILFRFRYYKFVLVADIAKMYRQVLVHHDDKKWQCILWRKNITERVCPYELQTVTYGTSCAPYLAVKCLQQLAKDESTKYPIGANITLKDFYVDNLMTGGKTEEEVREIKRQVTALLSSAGFPLRKFASNSESVLRDVPEAERETIVSVNDTNYIKTLGLKWSPTEDAFHFSFPTQQQTKRITKRSILSLMASFFDPMGFINPLIVRCKMLMQELWKLKLQWDESVPSDVYFEWKQICNELNMIEKIKIPRYVGFKTQTNVHVFADASQKAYGACIYVVSIDTNGRESNLVCAKSRVAPVKEVSLPRLELCASLLGSQLLDSVRRQFPTQPQEIVCWSDSTITLSWIAGDASRWPIFVSNRVTKIKKLTKGCTWRHVPSELNPADLLSRGTTTNNITKSFWLNGPEYLLHEAKNWPNEQHNISLAECTESLTTLIVPEIDDIVHNHKYVNNYIKLLRIFSYVQRFIKGLKRNNTYHGTICVEELQMSLLFVCKLIQRSTFSEDIKRLTKNKPLSTNSRLIQLSPFLQDGLLRVGGRLKNSTLPFATKHPVLLPSRHPYVKTIISYFHRKNLHAGPLTLHNILRDTFWIIDGRNAIKKVLHNCVLCYRCRPVTEVQVMGSLPTHRVEQSFPFNISGVDYCGPFFVSSQIRGRGPKKVYLAIFICFSVKAVHLELVPDLTTPAFISALKRFIARRGRCSVIYSDNATNFIGANKELRALLHGFTSQLHNKSVQDACQEEGIVWKLIPPRSPHFGGLWESSVKQAKYYIRRTIGNLVLTFDDLHTVCCQTEAIINSRPLTPFSSDPNDLRPLTPAHFLIGRLLTTIPEPTVNSNPLSLKSYQLIQWIQQQFWDRWRNEYLKLLQTKTKWTTTKANIKVNDLVMLKEDNIPPLKWPLARVIECHPGDDGIVRVVSVKTAEGTFKRAITKICKLPLHHEN